MSVRVCTCRPMADELTSAAVIDTVRTATDSIMWYYDTKPAIYFLDLDYLTGHFCSKCAIRFPIVPKMGAHQGGELEWASLSPCSFLSAFSRGRRSRPLRLLFPGESRHLLGCLPTFLRLYPVSVEASLHLYPSGRGALPVSAAPRLPFSRAGRPRRL